MAQRLEVPHAKHRRCDGLAVNDAALAKGHGEAEAVENTAAQDLKLDLAHELYVDLAVAFVPDDAQHWVLFLQFSQLRERAMRVCAVRQDKLIGQNRLQKRRGRLSLCAETESDIAVAEARDSDDTASARFLERAELDARIEAQLIGFFLIVLILRAIRKRCFHAQRSACDLEPREPPALRVARDLKDLRAKFAGIFRRDRETRKRGEKILHTVHLERRAEKTGENLAAFDHFGDQGIVDRAALQKRFKRRFITQGKRFITLLRRRGKIDAFRAQRLREPFHQGAFVCSRKIHLVDEEKRRHLVARQQAPERARMALHAVAAADDEHRVVKHRQRALHLGGKVNVSRRIEQRELALAHGEHGLLCKDRDAALALERIGIEEGIAVIYAPELPQRAGSI